MNVNKKKNITIKNRATHFSPSQTRVKVHFSSPDSYQSRSIKIEGYETRLYWQFRYCEEHQGQTFFYTLTYNDAAMPKYRVGTKKHTIVIKNSDGSKYSTVQTEPEYINCFDYEHLRSLLTGGFYQNLRRNYGTKFKYFVGAELGDGKGSRGMHNNPHYHVMFFLEPDDNPLTAYKPITPIEFRHLIRMYWQGFDEDVTGYQDYNTAKYGIAKEGENLGKVKDFRACMYCAKYVCKDVKLKESESRVERYHKFRLNKDNEFKEQVAERFYKEYIMPEFNTPLNPKKTKWCFTEEELLKTLVPDALGEIMYTLPWEPQEGDLEFYTDAVTHICRKYHLWKEYWNFRHELQDIEIKKYVNEWRNRYCNKCRISHGVGDYALNYIDAMEPSVQVPCKKGFKNRPIGMYYYRKLYLNHMIDSNGSVIYYLNDVGQAYKVANLPKQIKKTQKSTSSLLDIVESNPELFEQIRNSDVNTKVFQHYPEFLKTLTYLYKENNKEEITKRYAEYKLVYEDRFFPYQDAEYRRDVPFPDIDIIGDYEHFITPVVYTCPRNEFAIDTFIESNCSGFLPYSLHPYFARYIGVFAVLDMCADYFFVQNDNKSQREAEEKAETRRFHDREKLKEFYSRFQK